MASVMVDSCVLLDVITDDPDWGSWSTNQLSLCLALGCLTINPVIYAEVAFAYEQIEVVDEVLPRHLYTYRPIPREAAFLAARAHAAYRARGGSRQMILPDFLLGAHAVIERSTLLTRDGRRYRHAFPGLPLITPD